MHCFKGLKEKGKKLCYMITSKDTENMFGKNQYPFAIKSIS